MADQPPNELEPFPVRVHRLLNEAYRGIYHASKIHKFNEGTTHEWWEINEIQDLSTCDFDLLTRLVIGAHDECIRMEVTASGPRRVKLLFHNRRGRDGRFCHRHPTIEQAIVNYRGSARCNEYVTAKET